jgi:hypothetical protein
MNTSPNRHSSDRGGLIDGTRLKYLQPIRRDLKAVSSLQTRESIIPIQVYAFDAHVARLVRGDVCGHIPTAFAIRAARRAPA